MPTMPEFNSVSIIILILIIGSFYLFLYYNPDNRHTDSEYEYEYEYESFDIKPTLDSTTHTDQIPIIDNKHHTVLTHTNKIHPSRLPSNNNTKIKKRVRFSCPLETPYKPTDKYDSPEVCPLPVKSTDEFNNNFFTFRDNTMINSSIHADPVDKIQQLYLNKSNNNTIQNIFDNVTKSSESYDRQCVRVPLFDNVIKDGNYSHPGSQPTLMNRDNWSYCNEQIMNGGQFMPNVSGQDPMSDNTFDIHNLK
jgi:hypothetical protein